MLEADDDRHSTAQTPSGEPGQDDPTTGSDWAEPAATSVGATAARLSVTRRLVDRRRSASCKVDSPTGAATCWAVALQRAACVRPARHQVAIDPSKLV